MRRDVGIGVFLGVLLTGTAAAWFFWQRDADPDLIAVESFTTGVLAEAQARSNSDQKPAGNATEKPLPRRPERTAPERAAAGNAETTREAAAPSPAVAHPSPTGDSQPFRAAETARLSPTTAPASEAAATPPRPAESSAATQVAAADAGVPRVAAEAPSAKPPSTPPPPRKPRIHVVQENETLSQISQQYYGDSNRYRDILKANPEIKNEHKLRIGDRLLIPDEPVAAAQPASSPAPTSRKDETPPKVRTYVVRDNDTLYSIARRMLGDGERWRDLHRWNRKVIGPDATKLRKGMVLNLEENPPPASRP